MIKTLNVTAISLQKLINLIKDRFGHKVNTQISHAFVPLKGPKLEIFGSRVFLQIRPGCVGDLGTRRKKSKV